MEKDIVSILTTLNWVSTGLPIRKIVSLIEKRYFQYDKIDSRKEILPKQSKIDKKVSRKYLPLKTENSGDWKQAPAW